MRPLKRKPGLVMVERFHAAPRRLAMTIVARFPETPFMRIVRLVTVETPSGGVAELDRCGMTAHARHRLVGVPECKIRKCVIERLAVQKDDVGIPPLVIGMTMDAFLVSGIRLTPVKSLSHRTVRSNVLVAGKAQPGSCRP